MINLFIANDSLCIRHWAHRVTRRTSPIIAGGDTTYLKAAGFDQNVQNSYRKQQMNLDYQCMGDASGAYATIVMSYIELPVLAPNTRVDHAGTMINYAECNRITNNDFEVPDLSDSFAVGKGEYGVQ